jgi:hypothetical protein
MLRAATLSCGLEVYNARLRPCELHDALPPARRAERVVRPPLAVGEGGQERLNNELVRLFCGASAGLRSTQRASTQRASADGATVAAARSTAARSSHRCGGDAGCGPASRAPAGGISHA